VFDLFGLNEEERGLVLGKCWWDWWGLWWWVGVYGIGVYWVGGDGASPLRVWIDLCIFKKNCDIKL